MTGPRIVTFTQALIDGLPPSRYSADCPDGDFTCGHWAHGTRSPEGNVILSGEFAAFLDEKRAEARPDRDGER